MLLTGKKHIWTKIVCMFCLIMLVFGLTPTNEAPDTPKCDWEEVINLPFVIDESTTDDATELQDNYAGTALAPSQSTNKARLMALPVTSGGQTYYHANSGNSLRAVAQTLRKQDYESAVGFRIDAKKLFDYTNFLPSKTYASSRHREEFMKRGGTVAIHNHPSCCAFSPQDLYAEATMKTPIVMVITDRYIYTVQPKSGQWGDPESIKGFYAEQIERYYQEGQAYMASINNRYTRKQILSAPRTPDDGSFKWFYEEEIRKQLLTGATRVMMNSGLWATDQAMRQTARKFNLLYTRVETDEFNYADMRVFVPVAKAEQIVYAVTSHKMEPLTFGGTKHQCLPMQ